MTAVQNHFQATQIQRIHGALTEFNIPARSIVNTYRFPKLVRLDTGHRLIKIRFNFQLNFVWQFCPISREEFNTVVVIRIMRGADHDACLSPEGAGQISYARRRNRAQQADIHTCSRQTGFQCRFKHITGNPGVFTNQNAAFAALSKDLTGRPTEMHNKLRGNRCFTDPTTDTIGSKILSRHVLPRESP